ncbi:unnamed protein product [Phytomonas sp. Hart1]|nr:unnamed protein product [Phytomonas sp. Hart1]|eukprot:CCW69848.1 unnamed protein product [Phytomonas sp. isolate Hart1]
MLLQYNTPSCHHCVRWVFCVVPTWLVFDFLLYSLGTGLSVISLLYRLIEGVVCHCGMPDKATRFPSFSLSEERAGKDGGYSYLPIRMLLAARGSSVIGMSICVETVP